MLQSLGKDWGSGSKKQRVTPLNKYEMKTSRPKMIYKAKFANIHWDVSQQLNSRSKSRSFVKPKNLDNSFSKQKNSFLLSSNEDFYSQKQALDLTSKYKKIIQNSKSKSRQKSQSKSRSKSRDKSPNNVISKIPSKRIKTSTSSVKQSYNSTMKTDRTIEVTQSIEINDQTNYLNQSRKQNELK